MKKLKILVSIIVFQTASCKYLPEWAINWQKEQIKKRYSVNYVEKEKMSGWEKKIKQYEGIIEEKVEAGLKAGLLYRKLGESFAKMESFQPCVKNTKKAISLGIATPDVFYSLGLCQANMARVHNWDYKMTKDAEKNFLKVLNLSPSYSEAKFRLALIYFYGLSKNNKYRVASEYITISQKEYRKHAIRLAQEYEIEIPNNPKIYFALSGMYKIIGDLRHAKMQLVLLIDMLKQNYPQEYISNSIYKKAFLNLSILKKLR